MKNNRKLAVLIDADNVRQNQSSCDFRNCGYRKLSALIETTELFDIENRSKRGSNVHTRYIGDRRFSAS